MDTKNSTKVDKGGQKKKLTGFHSGKRLSLARDLRFLTNDELATEFRRQTNTVQKWIDKRRIPKGLIPAVANFFGVDEWMFSDDYSITEEEFKKRFPSKTPEAPPPSRKSRLTLFPIHIFLHSLSQSIPEPTSIKDDMLEEKQESAQDVSLPDENVPWDWEQVISSSSSEAEYHFHKGSECNKDREYDLAIFNLDKAIWMNTLNTDALCQAYYERGYSWYKKDDLKNAFQDYLKSLQTELDNPFQDLSFKWYSRNSGPESMKEFTELAEVFPDKAVVYYLRGLEALDLGDYDSAVADFDRAIDLEPGSGNIEDFHAVRGYVLYQKGLYSKTLNDFTHLIEKGIVIRPEILYFRALAYEKEGEIRDAIQDMEKCLRADPNREVYWEKLNALKELKKHKGPITVSVPIQKESENQTI